MLRYNIGRLKDAPTPHGRLPGSVTPAKNAVRTRAGGLHGDVGQDRGHHGGRQRHRASDRARAVRGRVFGGARRAPPRDARGDGRARQGDAAADARGADRRHRPGIDRGIVRHGQGDLWPDRSAVQQRRHQHAQHPDRGSDARAMVERRRGQPDRLVPLRAARVPHDEEPDSRAAGASSTTARSRPMCRGGTRRPTSRPSMH